MFVLNIPLLFDDAQIDGVQSKDLNLNQKGHLCKMNDVKNERYSFINAFSNHENLYVSMNYQNHVI